MSQDLIPIMVHLNIEGFDRDIVIASAYFAEDRPITPLEEVQRLVQFCNSRKNHLGK